VPWPEAAEDKAVDIGRPAQTTTNGAGEVIGGRAASLLLLHRA